MKPESEHTPEPDASPELVSAMPPDGVGGKASMAKGLRIIGWIAAWLVGVFLGLLLFTESCDFVILPVESFTGVLTGIRNLDAFALGRLVTAVVLVSVLALWVRLLRRSRPNPLAKFFVTLAVGAFYAAVTLAYLPEIGPLNLLMGGSDTVYGKGFSRSGFKKIRPGMTKAEVAALAGEGVDITAMWCEPDRERLYSDKVSCWFFSGPGDSQNYWQYGVEFTTNGVVDHTWCHFWYD